MPKMSATEFAEKWGRRLSSETESIRKGIERVSESPGKRAAGKKDKWVARMTSPDTHSRWAANVAATPVEEWKRAAIETGIPRIAGGVEKAQAKVSHFAEQLLSYQESLQSKVNAMPDTTYEQTKAKMVAWFDGMSKFRFKK